MSQGITPKNLLGDTAERDVRVGPTAHYTAYAWFRLGMPYAEWFKTETGARLFWSLRVGLEWLTSVTQNTPRLIDYLELRHRSIDHTLTRLAPDRVVELGAGLSRRGVTWALDHGVDYVEVDLPHMVDAKKKLLLRFPKAIRSTLEERLSLVSADVLAPDFEGWLAERLEGSRRPVIIAEGLLGYFDTGERRRLASAIAGALRRTQHVPRYSASFLCDLRVRSATSKTRVAVRAMRAAIRVVTRGRGAREDFDSEDAIYRLFTGAGFDAARPIDPAQVPDLNADLLGQIPMRVWHFTLTPSGSS
ncbi:MAG: class I SAM-dependent methyltransferase [Polyangiaceae bacterium]|nr:class I SAM-dependent methyltransferase [Myxococcales bacterium]MCB9584727.1 class I SAM-dependent methyltransferase [Polyangiaceae bacterium]MCB9607700.1 class I SAM-dependent methyltransferase [Polyangiaceae bacterium]